MHIDDYNPAYEIYPLMRRVDEIEEKIKMGNTKSFILSHALKNDAHVLIAIEHITVITDMETYTRIYTDDNDYTDVKESFKELTKMLVGRELNL